MPKQLMPASADGQENHQINYLPPQKKTNKSDCHDSEQPNYVRYEILLFAFIVVVDLVVWFVD